MKYTHSKTSSYNEHLNCHFRTRWPWFVKSYSCAPPKWINVKFVALFLYTVLFYRNCANWKKNRTSKISKKIEILSIDKFCEKNCKPLHYRYNNNVLSYVWLITRTYFYFLKHLQLLRVITVICKPSSAEKTSKQGAGGGYGVGVSK